MWHSRMFDYYYYYYYYYYSARSLFYFIFFLLLLLGLVVLPRLGDPFVSQNPSKVCTFHSSGQILRCAYTISSCRFYFFTFFFFFCIFDLTLSSLLFKWLTKNMFSCLNLKFWLFISKFVCFFFVLFSEGDYVYIFLTNITIYWGGFINCCYFTYFLCYFWYVLFWFWSLTCVQKVLCCVRIVKWCFVSGRSS